MVVLHLINQKRISIFATWRNRVSTLLVQVHFCNCSLAKSTSSANSHSGGKLGCTAMMYSPVLHVMQQLGSKWRVQGTMNPLEGIQGKFQTMLTVCLWPWQLDVCWPIELYITRHGHHHYILPCFKLQVLSLVWWCHGTGHVYAHLMEIPLTALYCGYKHTYCPD